MKKTLLFLLLALVTVATLVWMRHGGGAPYPDLTGPPRLNAAHLEEVLAYPEPIGNVAVSRQGRVFFTVHPEARPRGNKLLEYVDGASVPYPSLAQQTPLFDTPIGVAIDQFDRLWVIDHGNHGTATARIVAIDLSTGEVLRNQSLDASIAPVGSFLQDLQVSEDGRTIIIADASFWRKQPALIVYDVEYGHARRVLEGHPSVTAENYRIRTSDRDMAFAGGIVALRGGVDGIALGPQWLYYGALNGSGLYRLRLKDLQNSSLSGEQLAALVERYSDKPLSDGLSVDTAGGVYITDIEHNAIFRLDPDEGLSTLIRSPEVRWPDALSFGPDNYLYIADSALQDVIFKSTEHILAKGPYRVFRFQPGFEGVAGQ
jgi:sugar lactone lactonase YvrE